MIVIMMIDTLYLKELRVCDKIIFTSDINNAVVFSSWEEAKELVDTELKGFYKPISICHLDSQGNKKQLQSKIDGQWSNIKVENEQTY